MLQACLNGNRQRDAHPALPVTPQALAADAAAVAELGVTALHVHPRDTAGAEVLAGPEVATAVSVVRAAVPGVEISVTTGAWIQPDPVRRAELVAGWAALAAGRPDTASVNVHEDGWQHTCAALHSAGIGIELGVFHVPAAQALRGNGVPPGSVRVLAEVQPGESPAVLLAALSWSDLPILLHGQDDDAWPVFAEAARLGLSTRMGLEDALHRPDGAPTLGNADLIAAARALLGT
ncbi:3-keto-5-aminohexanoate cleavage protein [Kutzneria sp. NPDC051319]|uniref:3-keto-5-aminohexanoate cleavage protein n=1 Tax=Kutzneria sp. NPDC051319 TaxID=3155047 RepID=UPI003449D88D